jgi:hypothetical protein
MKMLFFLTLSTVLFSNAHAQFQSCVIESQAYISQTTGAYPDTAKREAFELCKNDSNVKCLMDINHFLDLKTSWYPDTIKKTSYDLCLTGVQAKCLVEMHSYFYGRTRYPDTALKDTIAFCTEKAKKNRGNN